jgi:small subunit ribosomal protein S16
MLKIRLRRGGRKHDPFFRIVVAKAETKRDGKYIDLVGTYYPKLYNSQNPDKSKYLILKTEKVKELLKCGAQPTKTVKELLQKNGIMVK